MQPTRNHYKIEQLLKKHKARVVSHDPFSVQLLYKQPGKIIPPSPNLDWVYEKIKQRNFVRSYDPSYRWPY